MPPEHDPFCRAFIGDPADPQQGLASGRHAQSGHDAWSSSIELRSAAARARSASLPASARSARPRAAAVSFSARKTSADSASTACSVGQPGGACLIWR